jgi:hypothetical protein
MYTKDNILGVIFICPTRNYYRISKITNDRVDLELTNAKGAQLNSTKYLASCSVENVITYLTNGTWKVHKKEVGEPLIFN